MKWTNVSEKKPALKESIVLAINYTKTKRTKFWRRKMIVFGWLDQIIETENGYEYRFYDHTHNCHWDHSVTHWMNLPEPPEQQVA